MKLLDRYIIRKFLVVLFFTTLAFIVIFIIVDLIENLDKFLMYRASLPNVIIYYIYYIPFIIILTLPVNMLLSSLFSIGSMAQYNEIIACQSAGISLYRIVAPLLMLAFLISLLSGIAGETVVPKSNRARLDLWRFEIKKETRHMIRKREQIAIQDSDQRQVFIKVYDGARKQALQVHIVWTDGNRIVQRWDARKMIWDDQRGGWMLQDVTLRQFTEEGEIVQHRDSLAYAHSQIHPDDLKELELKPEEMNYTELKRFVDRMLELGADARKWLVDLYMKISYPFANFIIVLFGAPLASRKRRSGPALGFALALLISFIYFLFLRSGQVLGHKGELSPWLAAWIGNIVFGIGGILLMLKIRK
ncbi:MAG: YjgP/YjgQ family permease [Calditrichaeota bacterium]|nr:YjgP/YjgQ family permease [Calditrichota bacterium]